MTLNKYLPFAFLYFFLNSVALPFGLTYTALLAPLFYAWILFTRKKEILWPFILILLPFVLAHMVNGVDAGSYARSVLNLLLVYIFCQAFYTFLVACSDHEKILRVLFAANFSLCLVAALFYFTPFFEVFWMEQDISRGIKDVRRLKMFTYEPSNYALMFTPLFFFFLLQFFFRQNRIPPVILFFMLLLPLAFSFSLGVMGSIFIATCLTWLFWFRRLTRKRRVLNTVINSAALGITTTFMMLVFFKGNSLFARLANVFRGDDSSGKGRTVDSFILADRIAASTSQYWGAGPGQVKVAGETIFRDYYLYYSDFTAAIPNAVAETFAVFGWFGISLRFLVEIGLFFHTRVWTNYYRLLLFLFMFVYQFSGSYLTGLGEYVIWILAFTNVFPQFDVGRVKRRSDGICRDGFQDEFLHPTAIQHQ